MEDESIGPLVVERRGAVARLLLNRPRAMNAIDPAMAAQLRHATAELAEDQRIRCVVVAGAGEHFMAGGDIRHFAELLQLPPERRDAGFIALIDDVGAAVANLRHMPKPVVGAVRGAAAGFGFSLMCACDLVLASDTTVCKLAYCGLGASPDGGGSFTLPRILGERRARELALLDERIDAERALALGLVTRVLPDAALDDAVDDLAQNLAGQATAALGRTKALILAAADQDLAAHLEAERTSFLAAAASQDFAEAVAAFTAKRKPEFCGR